MTSTCGDPGTGCPVSASSAGVTTCTGDSSAVSTGSASRAACIAWANPAPVSRCARPVDEPGRHTLPEHDLDQVGGPFGRYVPERGQRHRGGVEDGTEADRVDLPTGRWARRGRGPTGAVPPRQQILGAPPDHLHIPDLRPGRAGSRRVGQIVCAATAGRRRLHLLALLRIRIPDQTMPGMPRLPAPRPVRATLPRRVTPLPLAGLTFGFAAGLRRDRLLRRGCPGIVATGP